MKVLVTGATSALGSHVVALLTSRGDEASVMQRHASGLAVAETIGDITDPAAAAAAVDGCDAVVHLAAKVAATGRRREFERVNIDGTANIIAAARAAGVDRFVHVSTPSVAHHGDALVGAVAGPADPDQAHGHYAITKAVAERAALAASDSGMVIVAVRPHLVWGPGDQQLVGRIIQRARAGRFAFIGSGNALIDTTYIDNAATALVAALDHAPTLGGQALVVSNGEPRSVHEIVSRILGAADLVVPRRHVPETVARRAGQLAEVIWNTTGRKSDPPMTSFVAEQLSTAHWFDQRHTREALDWEPAISLDEGFVRLAESLAD